MENLLYSKEHLWVGIDGSVATIGITSYALRKLGHVMFWNLPETGEETEIGTAFGDIEGVKKVSDLISPVSGKVVGINDSLMDNPDLINESPYEAWLIKVEFTENEELMDETQYGEYVKTL